MRPTIGGNDARGMVYLVKQDYITRPLNNLQLVVVIDGGKHRDSLLSHRDTALLQRPILVAVQFVSLVIGGTLGVSFSSLRQHGRNDALWPYNKRGSPV